MDSVAASVRRASSGAHKSITRIEKQILEKMNAAKGAPRDAEEELHEIQLTHTKKSVVEKKDFSSEIRGKRDIEGFVTNSDVLLDIHETQLEAIVDKLLNSMFSKNHKISTVSQTSASGNNAVNTNTLAIPDQANDRIRFPSGTQTPETVTRQELKGLIFSDDTRTQFSEFIQSTIMPRYDVASKHSIKENSPVEKSRNYEQHRKRRVSTYEAETDDTWLCATISVPTLLRRYVGIARLKHATNFGPTLEEVKFVILILCPSEVKLTKTALETGRSFATLFSNMALRHDLLDADSVEEFKANMQRVSHELAEYTVKDHSVIKEENGSYGGSQSDVLKASVEESKNGNIDKWYHAGSGIKSDLAGRLPYYFADYKDGIIGKNTIQKTISTTLFLYFSVILPAIALGVLNSKTTHGAISVHQVLVGQTLGALIFTILAGQPLVVVMTTAPLALFIKTIYTIADDNNIDFLAFYAAIGLWNTFFLFIYSFFNMSRLMKYSSRSTEEIFSNFITIAFIVDSTKNMVKTFEHHFWNEQCRELNSNCKADVAFLSLILMLGTVWLGVTLYEFTRTPFLSKGTREFFRDYALPVAVIVFSLVGSILFHDVELKYFSYKIPGTDEAGSHSLDNQTMTNQTMTNQTITQTDTSTGTFQIVDFHSLGVADIFGAMGLGFSLSLLFFMDQNISAAMVDSPDNKLVKGNAYNWDLLVVAVINGILCIFGLPFMHAVLPHSPLHVKCLADTEERVEAGHVRSVVVRVRETRLTNLFSNILIGISMLFLKYVLDYIPTPVLDGLFLYLAVTALYGNQMFERITLLFTEQAAYPPNHYIRKVPQRKIHLFTGCQCIQLLVLCAFGFAPTPYAKMIFPVVILFFLPVRHKIIPYLIEKKYLNVLDG